MVDERKEIAPGITVDSESGFGKPVIKGTRVEVAAILKELASGSTYDDLERKYKVGRKAILAAIGYAYEIIDEERLAFSGQDEGPREVALGITVDYRVRFGKPVLKGTRVDAATVLGHLAAGDSVDSVAKAYRLTTDNVRAALGYAYKVVSSETVSAI